MASQVPQRVNGFMARAGLTKGITRLLIVASVVWVTYCLFVIPEKAASDWFVIAIGARQNGDIARADTADHEARFVVQLREHLSSPYMWLLTFFPPALAYAGFRLVLAIGYWIYAGFRL